MSWIRARFLANYEDWRPIKWPPPGPCWCTGYAGDNSHSTVVAYVRSLDQATEFWPEAEDIVWTEEDQIRFTSRFPRPEWWNASAADGESEGTGGGGER